MMTDSEAVAKFGPPLESHSYSFVLHSLFLIIQIWWVNLWLIHCGSLKSYELQVAMGISQHRFFSPSFPLSLSLSPPARHSLLFLELCLLIFPLIFSVIDQLDEAFAVLQRMKDLKFKIPISTYTNLIKGCIEYEFHPLHLLSTLLLSSLLSSPHHSLFLSVLWQFSTLSSSFIPLPSSPFLSLPYPVTCKLNS